MIPKVELTSKGAALLAKVPEGQTAQVTRWQIGTGALPPGSSLDRTALVEPLKYLSLSGVERRGNNASVLGQFVNTGMAAFVWEELGLWASDPEEGEVLMCYGNALGAGEAIQAGSENLREFIFGTELIFSSQVQVTGTVDTALVFIPQAEKGQPEGVATLDENGKLVQDIDCGVWDTDPVEAHNATATAHANLLVDGNNVEAVDISESLEEHMANPLAHQNLVIDGNAGQ